MTTLTMKFGGTSVGSPEAIRQTANIIKASLADNNRVIVVLSAMSGVTDLLLKSAHAAIDSDKWTYMSINETIREKHEEVVNMLIDPGEEREAILKTISDLLDQQLELCEAINILNEATPRILDAILSFGERLSCRVIAAILQVDSINAKAYDSSNFIVTNRNYQNAEPIWSETETHIHNKLLPEIENGITPIITGFIGSTPDGTITTLGRGGSDFSAAIFAANTDSNELIIWTDVDGVMTADPRLDKRARVLPYVSYQEVGELAFYGAKVLHPKTVQPIINRDIPMRVRNTFNPSHEGTLIGAEMAPSKTIIKAVTSINNVSMLTVSGKGMLGVPGIVGRTFIATANAGASILMISQSSSEQSFCFTVIDQKADTVKNAVEKELAREIHQQDVDSVEVLSDIVIITVVGAGMRGTPGVAGRVFTVMGNSRLNVLAIAQGSSECSISFIVKEEDLKKAVVILHDLALETVENGFKNGELA